MGKNSDAKIAAGPPVGNAASSGPKPIGVPTGYLAQTPGKKLMAGLRSPIPEMQQVAPRYFEGMEWDPTTLSPEDRAQVQLAMREAGLYSKNQKFTLGIWDESTRTAYKKLLAYANGTGQEWNQALKEYASAGGGMGMIDADTGESAGSGGRGGGGGLVKRSTNPSDLAATFEVIYRDRTGRKPSSGELSRMVNTYLGAESGQQDALAKAQESGGNVSDLMDPKLFAQQQAEATDAEGAFRQDAINTFRTLGDVLTGGGFGGD